MKNIVLFAHGTHENRGCEAIVRSTSSLLHNEFKNADIYVGSYNPEGDENVKLPYVKEYLQQRYVKSRFSLDWVRSVIQMHMLKDKLGFFEWLHRDVIRKVNDADLVLSIGGDNYCYGAPYSIYSVNRAVKKNQDSKLILFGASIEPSAIDDEMRANLDLHDALIVRESITYEALVKNGLGQKSYLYPDPAFTMEQEIVDLPEAWEEGNMIGLNISPLIMSYETNGGVVSSAANSLVKHILESTNHKIALIPHVENDIIPLRKLYDDYKESGRVVLIENNYTAPQLKYIISQCRMLIGARTHATIAAYSTCVPTLVIGYSVKAKGIAKDLFGNSEGLILPVQELKSEKQLIDYFDNFISREKELRSHLESIIPEYKKKAYESVNVITNILNKSK